MFRTIYNRIVLSLKSRKNSLFDEEGKDSSGSVHLFDWIKYDVCAFTSPQPFLNERDIKYIEAVLKVFSFKPRY